MRTFHGRQLMLTVAALLVAPGLAAWTPWGRSNTVMLGAVVQLTGSLAHTGRYYRDAYQLTVDKINDAGGITVGGKTYKIALKLLDSKSDPTLEASLHERLIAKEKVKLLLGPFSSNTVLTGSTVAEKYQVPMVQGGGSASRIFSRGNKYVFGTLPPAEDYFHSTIDMLSQLEPVPKTVGVVSTNDSFGSSLLSGTVAHLKKAGLTIAFDLQYSERFPNFMDILRTIKTKTPDVLLWGGQENGALKFIRESKSDNVTPKLFASFTEGVSSANFRSVLGKDANYTFGLAPWLPSERLKDRWFGDANQFAGAYEKKFGYAPDYHAAAAAAAVEAHVAAIEAAGSIEPKNVRDALAQVDFDSLYGRIRFQENGQILLPQTVIQIQDGQVVEIFADRLINRPLYPVPPWDNRS